MCGARRIGLDLPGRGEFCYRFVKYLAVGACVIGPELATEMPVPLESGVHLVRVPRSRDGLIDKCERLLRDDSLRNAIGGAAEDYCDRYLALEQLGSYYGVSRVKRLRQSGALGVGRRRCCRGR